MWPFGNKEQAITDGELEAYAEERLPQQRMAAVEAALRADRSLRQRLEKILAERASGYVSVGAIWRQRRLSCPSREQLGAFLLDAIDPQLQSYIKFHIEEVGCPYCAANLADIRDRSRRDEEQVKRRRRLFESSIGHLKHLRNSREAPAGFRSNAGG